jgi:plasmanylethanolamine desaturase
LGTGGSGSTRAGWVDRRERTGALRAAPEDPRRRGREVRPGDREPTRRAGGRFAMLDAVGFLALALALGWALPRLAPAAAAAPSALLVVAALGGLVAADLACGVIHWIGDTFFEPETPWLGPWLVAPFREHHRDPAAIAEHGFAEVGGSSALAVAPAVAAGGALAALPGALAAAAGAFLVSLGLACAATNAIHRWAHVPRPPTPVAWLQRRGLILSPAHHARHHAGDHRRAYCITTGWLNPVLDRTQLFACLERWLRGHGSLRRSRAH